jgi:hypothetical protein
LYFSSGTFIQPYCVIRYLVSHTSSDCSKLTKAVFAIPPFAKDLEKDVVLGFKIDNDIREVCLFDRGRIQQIAANLTSNCIKLESHEGMGKVDVSAKNLVDGEDVLLDVRSDMAK